MNNDLSTNKLSSCRTSDKPPILHQTKCTISCTNSEGDLPYYWYYENLSKIPTYFWRSKVIKIYPIKFDLRKNICMEITDLNHYKLCQNKEFHPIQSMNKLCICLLCGEQLEHYHQYFICFPCKEYPEYLTFS